MGPLRRKCCFFLLLFLGACAPKTEISYEPLEGGRGFRYKETGFASWYGEEYHGRKTSNGEVYNMYAMTAAHLTLPFNTLVQVTNLENGRRVEMRINDRGPFIAGRIIDLSFSGARAIDMLSKGTAKVAVEATVLSSGGPPPVEGNFAIQVGAFAQRENAERFQAELRKRYPQVHMVLWESNIKRVYRIRLGSFPTEAEARRYMETLKKEDLKGFVVRED